MIFASCIDRKTDTNEVNFIQVDTNKKIKFSEIFTEYSLFFPETTDSSLIGAGIGRIEISDDSRLYLLNLTNSGYNILCFNSNGSFNFCLDRKGDGPGEYSYLGDFFIDRKLNSLVLVVEGGKIMYFTLDGQYLSTKEFDSVHFIRYMRELDDSLYVAYCDCEDRKECADIIFIDRTTLSIKSSVESTSSEIAFFNPQQSIACDNERFWFYDANDTIYDIASQIGRKEPFRYVNFGKNKNNIFANGSRFTKDPENILIDKLLRVVISFHFNGQYFAINYCEYDNNNKSKSEIPYRMSSVFYDPATNTSFNSNNIEFDIFKNVNFKRIWISGCRNGYFYAVINDIYKQENIERMIKSKFLPESTKNELRNMNEESNPVILLFK